MSVFAQKKMCAFQRSSEHVVIRRVARLSRIGARLMFGHPGHVTASPQALQGALGLRRPAGGSAWLIFIGGPRFGRPLDPPSSRLLSQPPHARFERLSQVGRCRGLQGWEVLDRQAASDAADVCC